MNRAALEQSKIDFLASVAERSPYLRGMPTELTIELTSRCQLACVICPRENIHKPLVANRSMSWDFYRSLVERYVPHLDFLSLAGGLGEPLLFPRFTEAVRLARSANPTLFLSISTNALLPRTVKVLRAVADDMTVVQVSMDAVGNQFDKIVGQADAFPVFEKNVRALVPIFHDSEVELRFNAVVTPNNIDGLDQVVATVAAWGGKNLFLNGMNLAATNQDVSGYHFYLTPSYVSRMQELTELGDSIGVAVGWMDQRSIKGFSSCTAPWNNFYIAWNGALVACCAKPFPELLNFGNVDDGGLAVRMNDERLVGFRRLSILNQSPDFCRSCGSQYVADGNDGGTRS
jgi:MoaA/NifB/PqqE/SkfB family radical SAM enzyme